MAKKQENTDTQVQVIDNNIPATLEDLSSIPQTYSKEDLEDILESKWFQRLKLMTSRSKVVESGEFPVNHYALQRNKSNIDLGSTVDVMVCAVRIKALKITGDEVIVSYERGSALYSQIENEADTIKDSNCMYGPEFLVYIPEKQVFATFFMSTKTMRNDAPALASLLMKNATLGSKKIETSKYTYTSASISPCSLDLQFHCSREKLFEVIDRFKNPPVDEKELAESDVRER